MYSDWSGFHGSDLEILKNLFIGEKIEDYFVQVIENTWFSEQEREAKEKI
jgi:hypothetical protein